MRVAGRLRIDRSPGGAGGRFQRVAFSHDVKMRASPRAASTLQTKSLGAREIPLAKLVENDGEEDDYAEDDFL